MIMRKLLFSMCCLLGLTASQAQTTTTISSGTTQISTGVTYNIPFGFFVNNGVYIDTTSPGAMNITGGVTFSGSGTTKEWNLNFLTSGSNDMTAAGVQVYGTATLNSGVSLNAGAGKLYLRTDDYLTTIPGFRTVTMVNNGFLTGTITGLVTKTTATSGACPFSPALSLNISGTSMAYQWQSSPDNATWTAITGATNVTYIPTVPVPTYYSCVLTTNNTAYTQNTPGLLITPTGGPTVGISGGTTPICTGGAGTSLSGTGATTYTWAPPGSLSSSAGTTVTANPTVTTTYTVTGTTSGCTSTATRQVTVNTTPSISVNPTDKAICAGASTTSFSVTAAGTGLTYQWWVSTNGGVSYTSLTNIAPYSGTATSILTLTQATTALNGNIYYCIVNGTCFIPDTSTAATLTVTPPPVITGVTPMAAGPTATLTITGTGFNTTTTNNVVYFGSDMGTVNTASATSLNVSVPNGGTFDRITSINLGCKLMAYAQYPFLPDFTASSATPSFNPKTDVASGANFPMDIVTADFDGDGKPDIAVTNGQWGNWSVFRNTSTATTISYGTPITFTVGPAGQSIWGMAVGDLNRDGKIDVVVGDRDSSKIDVYINTSTVGSISFATRVKYSVTHPWGIKVADLDGDGRPDIIVAGDDQQKFSYFRNIYNGAAAFNSTSFATKVDVLIPSSQEVFSIAIGDIDGDGKPDVVTGNSSSAVDNIQVFRNTSTGPGVISFASAVTSSAAQYLYYIDLADLDGDGKLDIVASSNSNGYATVVPNASSVGSIAFGTPVNLTGVGGGYGVAIADFTGHGKPDVAWVNSDGVSNNVVSVFRNNSTPGSFSFSAATNFATNSTQEWGIVGVDMNGDGKPDMVTADYQGTNISSYLNNLTTTTSPVFVNGSPQPFVLCGNAAATAINSLLTISDVTPAKTETWSVFTAPNHGTLSSFAGATASSGSTSITPTGLTYTPTAGFSGLDTFIIQVTDGTTPSTTMVLVTVNPSPSAITNNVPLQVNTTLPLGDLTGGGTWTSFSTGVATVGTTTGLVNGVSIGTSLVSYTLTSTGCRVTATVTVNAASSNTWYSVTTGSDASVLTNWWSVYNNSGYQPTVFSNSGDTWVFQSIMASTAAISFGGNVSIISGGKFTPLASGNTNVGGNFTQATGGSFVPNTGTVTLNGTLSSITAAGMTTATTNCFYNLSFNAASATTYTINSSILLMGNFTNLNSNATIALGSHTITIGGNFANPGPPLTGASNIIMNGTSPVTMTGNR